MDYAIETRGLSRRFGRTEAVVDLTLKVPAGSVFAFIGPNGAGKTTTIKALMNLIAPSAGSASVLGVDSRRLGPATLGRIGYVSENQELPAWMTIAQLVDYCRPFYPTWDATLAGDLARQLDLPLDRPIRACSRGMAMKAALLASLAYRPEVLVMDEPFAGLDALEREEFSTGVLELAGQERPWTVFVSSHDVDEVERLADWIGVINQGRLVLAEPVASLLARFRRVEVLVDDGAHVPDGLPPAWLGATAAGRTMQFVDSAYDEADLPARVRALVPAARDLTAAPMTLRDIFIALARMFRLAER